MKTLGEKFDAGKPEPRLLPAGPLMQIVEILTFGARKYQPDNWQHVDGGLERYHDAMLRHIYAWQGGERFDPESDMHHLAHAGCCLLFLMWFADKEDR